MARKRYSDDDCLKVLREIELHLAAGMDIPTDCHAAGISDATYHKWRKRYAGKARLDLTEKKALEKENQRLKKSVSELEPDKLILQEAVDFLQRKG